MASIIQDKTKLGDYFLLPYSGKRRDLIIKVVRPLYYGQWFCVSLKGQYEFLVLVSSCERCPPYLAKRILKGADL